MIVNNKHKPLVIFISFILYTAIVLVFTHRNITKKYSSYLDIIDPEGIFGENLFRKDEKSDFIRSFGCNRDETPLIFVHIGKAGGGSVRVRLAASAQNYTRTSIEWRFPKRDEHFYSIVSKNNTKTSIKFCNEKYKRHRPMEYIFKNKKHDMPCAATTPIGNALACPNLAMKNSMCSGCDDLLSPNCTIVYTGHSLIGSELHWLPPKYLKKWWKQNISNGRKEVTKLFKKLSPSNKNWCKKEKKKRPKLPESVVKDFKNCGKPLAEQYDSLFLKMYGSSYRINGNLDYSNLYASLPLHRVVVLREPFSWLISKFAWHNYHISGNNCSNITQAIENKWAHDIILHYLFYLCGDDCLMRYTNANLTVAELEQQVVGNLRHSFSVVGLSHEMDLFYQMISKRISYIDTSLNPHIDPALIEGMTLHKSSYKIDVHCKDLYNYNETFKKEFADRLPILRVLIRIYNVGVEVNRFQMKELTQCSGKPFHKVP